jgi:hypothetical protein
MAKARKEGTKRRNMKNWAKNTKRISKNIEVLKSLSKEK